MFQPQRAPLDINEVPDPATAGHFVLPLLHRNAAVITARQPSFQPMVARALDRLIWPRPQFTPRKLGISRSLLTQPIPPLSSLIRRKPQLPLPLPRRRRNPIPPLRAHRPGADTGP